MRHADYGLRRWVNLDQLHAGARRLGKIRKELRHSDAKQVMSDVTGDARNTWHSIVYVDSNGRTNLAVWPWPPAVFGRGPTEVGRPVAASTRLGLNRPMPGSGNHSVPARSSRVHSERVHMSWIGEK